MAIPRYDELAYLILDNFSAKLDNRHYPTVFFSVLSTVSGSRLFFTLCKNGSLALYTRKFIMPLSYSIRYACLFALVLMICTATSRADLLEFIKRPDPAFSWKLKGKTETAQGIVYDLHLVSQVWQGVAWEHEVQVFLPKDVQPTATMFLWNQGGTSNFGSMVMGMEMARKMKAPVAFLYGVPNQPLLDGKHEDALIAETFVRYLDTKDPSWPLLFPMVKSLTRAMDALQQFARQEWKIEVTHFVVSGGSKRGWTAWLSAAVDPRVKALVPCVFDTLNMQAQLSHQLQSYGKYSEMIVDYTKRSLVPVPNTEDARKLWMMVDPWFYRDRLKQPKMIVNGSNDPYWTQDALNLYWDDLKGDKWVLYVPNAGHNLVQQHDTPTILPDRSRAMNTVSRFYPASNSRHAHAEDQLAARRGQSENATEDPG